MTGAASIGGGLLVATLALSGPLPLWAGEESVFGDGFASGSNCAWSAALPAAAQPIGFAPVTDRTTDGSTVIGGSCVGSDAAEKVFAIAVPGPGKLLFTLQPELEADLGLYVRSSCAPEDEVACFEGAVAGGLESGEIAVAGAGTLFVFVDGWDTSAGEFEVDFDFADCGNGVPESGEECDDGDADETDGCTSECQTGAVCTADALPGGDRFEVDPATAHCYVSFDDDQTTFGAAQTACENAGGHLVAITSSVEQSIVESVWNGAQNPWIGASDVDVEGSFGWVTSESFVYTNWLSGEPDDDSGGDGLGDCVALAPGGGGAWLDTNCNFTGFVTGRICELPPTP